MLIAEAACTRLESYWTLKIFSKDCQYISMRRNGPVVLSGSFGALDVATVNGISTVFLDEVRDRVTLDLSGISNVYVTPASGTTQIGGRCVRQRMLGRTSQPAGTNGWKKSSMWLVPPIFASVGRRA